MKSCNYWVSNLQFSPLLLSYTLPKQQKLKCSNPGTHIKGINNACKLGDKSCTNRFPFVPIPNSMEETIGAEYGEGFVGFTLDGPLQVDVDFLNSRLQEDTLQRMRHVLKPDEAYGLIFSWECVVADTRHLRLATWRQLASEEGKEIPNNSSVERVMLRDGADDVLYTVFFYKKGSADSQRLKQRFSRIYKDRLLELEKPLEGLAEWLHAASASRIPCAVVSILCRRKTVDILRRMKLDTYFQAVVTEEDGMESIAHGLLSAAVKLDRKPSNCVVFEDDPRGIAAAHNCTMMAVAMIGTFPAYDLGQADVVVSSFTQLSIFNLRSLFSSRGYSFMDPQNNP